MFDRENGNFAIEIPEIKCQSSDGNNSHVIYTRYEIYYQKHSTNRNIVFLAHFTYPFFFKLMNTQLHREKFQRKKAVYIIEAITKLENNKE